MEFLFIFYHRFVGVYYRPRNEVHLFEKGAKHGSQGASVRILPWGDPALEEIIADDLFQQLQVCLSDLAFLDQNSM